VTKSQAVTIAQVVAEPEIKDTDLLESVLISKVKILVSNNN
jgi:hypothetical protein